MSCSNRVVQSIPPCDPMPRFLRQGFLPICYFYDQPIFTMHVLHRILRWRVAFNQRFIFSIECTNRLFCNYGKMLPDTVQMEPS